MKKKYLTTTDELKAISDPFKYKILTYFSIINSPATVKQVADAMKETPAKVYYHVKKLEKLDMLHLVKTKTINGIVAKYYQRTAEDFEINLPNEYEGLQKNNSKILMSESQNIFSNFYDISKRETLSNLVECEKEHIKRTITVTMNDLYLTPDEAKEFYNYLIDFVNKNKNLRTNEPNTKKYHFFFNLMEKSDSYDK